MSASAKLQKLFLNQLSTTIKSLTLTAEAPQASAKLQSFNLNRLSTTIQSLTLRGEAAPPPPQQATLTGTVSSILGPVGRAKVTLNAFEATTDSSGKFQITAIPYGTYTLTVAPQSLIHKILLRSFSEKMDIYNYTVTKTVSLPLNLLNVSIMGTATIAVLGTTIYFSQKPSYYY